MELGGGSGTAPRDHGPSTDDVLTRCMGGTRVEVSLCRGKSVSKGLLDERGMIDLENCGQCRLHKAHSASGSAGQGQITNGFCTYSLMAQIAIGC